MNDVRKMGRVTIPTDTDAVSETLDLLKRWGADAIRDCDGTEFPQELKDTGAKIYATYYTTRKDNAWAKANPDETQQCYIMTPFYTAEGGALTIPLMTGISRELMKVNDHDDIARWWEVMDRTTGEPVPTADWHYDAASESVVIDAPAAYHEYTVSFLAYLIWDPVHMYNSVINDWKDVEHQIPFDVRQPKTHAYTLRRLREYLESHPYVNVVRFTTFFHLFTLVFDELRREKYVDWYGYSASVSPYILEQFEKEVGLDKGKDYDLLRKTDINWLDVVFNDKAMLQNYEVSVNRATDRLNYYVSGNFFDQDGIAQGSGFRRYNMRANADVKASNWLKVGTTSTVSYEDIEQAQTGEYTSVTPISASHFMMPYWNPYNEDGSIASTKDDSWTGTNQNPLDWMRNNPVSYKKYKVLSTLYAEVNPIKGLTIKSQFAADYAHMTAFSQSFPSFSTNNNSGTAGRSSNDRLSLTITNTA